MSIERWGWGWTGFTDYIGPPIGDNQNYFRGKTLWDFLGLLIIPVVLAMGALWFNRQEKEREQYIAKDRQQEEALQII
jgi:hypothetical protein